MHPIPAPAEPIPRGADPSPPGHAVEPMELCLELVGDGSVPAIPLEPGELTLLEADRGAEAIRQRLVLACASQGRSCLHVVGGNRLDPLGLARRAQAARLDPGYVLASSTIARAFTAYQLSVLIEETLPELLAGSHDAALAMVSDPLALYTDEDVRQREGRILAERAAGSLVRTAREHERPLLVLQAPVPGGRDGLAALRAVASQRVVIRHAPGNQGQSQSQSQGPFTVLLPERGQRFLVARRGPWQARIDRFAQAEGQARDRGDRRAPVLLERGRAHG